MTAKRTYDEMISRLLADPAKFVDSGEAYDLLQYFFHGVPARMLRPLLLHQDTNVRRSAAFIASELGIAAKSVVREAAQLVSDMDRHTKWYAMETVLVCAIDDDVDLFTLIIQQLENENEIFVELAMTLISNACSTQLDTVLESCNLLTLSSEFEKRTIGSVVNTTPTEALRMLNCSDSLIRKFGAMASKRMYPSCPLLLVGAASNPDPVVRQFACEALETLKQ